MANNNSPDNRTVFLADYTPPAFHILSIALHFALDAARTTVRARSVVQRQPWAAAGTPLCLFGEELELLALRVDGRPLDGEEYHVDAESLTIHNPPASFELEIETAIQPERNTALEGLYASGGNLCTQCESEGFRKITYYPDRPDVMGVFTTTLEADQARYPVLLSNGNCIARGELEGGRHFATWHDPFPKPSYLFALVAGDLACVRDSFTTCSGRVVALELYVQHGNEDKCAHALASLKKAMAWDERAYGRVYDLDSYMIVAVDDFNMGAMENKGLNIFNSKFVLARPDTATDDDYLHIEGVIAHEYFHNWSG
ncbi:MAG TPA: M1 family aminopeptidase, partial [Gammaproteobacteria bacterium]